MIAVQELKPELKTPFPRTDDYIRDPKTGIMIPKHYNKNIEWRANLVLEAEDDLMLRQDLVDACSQSLLFWLNTFMWTYHQFDVDPATGEMVMAVNKHEPFITWEIQDGLFDKFEECYKLGKDILVAKARDMGASWCCLAYMHWLWLFRDDVQLLEMSRTRDYVDQTGNMKALFQKHDYINEWLPEWMVPRSAMQGGKNRTSMHMLNSANGSCIDGESTTEHAGSGDRRAVVLLDEFSKVKNGAAMRSATADVTPMRIVNSTPSTPGSEYAKWRKSGQILVYELPYWDHPQKGAGRYLKKKNDGSWSIRSPWFDIEEERRSPKEIAREILMCDSEAGDMFFTPYNISLHRALYCRDPKTRWNINLDPEIPTFRVEDSVKFADQSAVIKSLKKMGPLRVWTNLICGRPDQSKTYVFGIDISKGHGSSNSVVSIKCKETGEKIAEWRDANTPPYEFARVVIALAIWCGGNTKKKLPYLKWEKNGPGYDFGTCIVEKFKYPYFYSHIPSDKKIKTVGTPGWHSNTKDKEALLSLYDRVLAHGGYVNHSDWGLEELTTYIYYSDGSIGPADLMEENSAAKKTHGDVVIADALTLEDKDLPKSIFTKREAPHNSMAGRRKELLSKRKRKSNGSPTRWNQSFNFEAK